MTLRRDGCAWLPAVMDDAVTIPGPAGVAPPHYIMSAVLVRVLYALSDAKITVSGNKRDCQETMMTSMEISTTSDADDRIAVLEKKVRDMEALVRGLTAELLDLKTVTMTKSRKGGERSREELKQGTVVRGTTLPATAGQSASQPEAVPADSVTVIRPRGARQQDAPVETAEPKMARIMQADGTMKMEPRYGDKNSIDSSRGDGRTRKGASARSRQNPLVYTDEEDK
jgi:hypothetical protein